MTYTNLPSLIEALRREGELTVIEAPVDPVLELAEIHRRVIDDGGPALLFTNVKGSAFPVVTNLFGTIKRVNLAFGTRPEELMKRVVGAVDKLLPPKPAALWGERDMLWDLMKVGLRRVPASRAPIRAHHLDRDPLAGLPAITSWQEDGGPFVTLPLVYTEHPQHQKQHNLGMYRMQVFDASTTGMHWQIQKGGGFHHHEAELRGEALPVSVFLGGPPALIASAIAPVPEHLPELLLASLIVGGKLPVTDNPHSAHPMPAEAEFVLSGKVPPHVRRLEGPFGDHFGYYSLAHEFPVFEVGHLWHRRNAIYPATIVGKPRQEDYYLGDFLQRLLSPAFPMVMPAVKELWTYAETGFHSLAAAVVRESYSREALVSAFRILGEGQLSLTKFLMLTDQPVELVHFPQLLEAVLARFDPHTDLFVFDKTSHDTLDYTGGKLNHGSKAVMLGVGEPRRELPAVYDEGAIEEVGRIEVYCRGCLVVSGAAYTEEPELAQRLVQRLCARGTAWPLVILADEAGVAGDQTAFLWTVFTRFNPADDIYAEAVLAKHHVGYALPLVIDARMKPGYPDELIPDPAVTALVDRRWKEYFA
ncbi:UbiD family decarboxylase [Paenibacillus sp. IB182496]|uniref:UbiD family decarboxylase n=1 Tax=Paenibacillus sabuli TaxID=2772509 RepID=A0A927BS03_9BACL|nr:UbiD family decarboxylase [Paenibacillus sabuli]MBD2845698.1 UbiD family decarboxylase [Paenibacillus sabuli]